MAPPEPPETTGLLSLPSLSPVKARTSVALNCRAVARFENPEGRTVLGGDNVPSLLEIGLTDLSKSGGVRAPPP